MVLENSQKFYIILECPRNLFSQKLFFFNILHGTLPLNSSGILGGGVASPPTNLVGIILQCSSIQMMDYTYRRVQNSDQIEEPENLF